MYKQENRNMVFATNKLFKYFSFDENYKDLFNSIIDNPTLRLKSATSFNDPNEFKFRFMLDQSDMESIREEYFAEHPKLSEDQFLEWNKGIGTKQYKDFILNDMRFAFMGRFKVCSFSQIGNSNLMWSHYADSHRGIVIIYNDPKEYMWEIALNTPTVIKKVLYADTPSDLKIPQPPIMKILEVMCLRKQKEWQYEEEIRMVSLDETDSDEIYYSIDRDAIHGVILGSRIDSSIKDYLFQLCIKHSILVYQAENIPEKYELKISSISPITNI